jgi:hypothetical protein
VSFAAITLCVASQVFIVVIVYFVIDSVWKLLDTPLYFSVAISKVGEVCDAQSGIGASPYFGFCP